MSEDYNILISRIEEAEKFPILNENTIQSIFNLGDQTFAENLILQYLKKAEQINLDIDESIKRKKTSNIYALANELRDSSLYIGTERIAVISYFLYKHAKRRNITPLKEAGIKLAETLDESEKALKLLINSGSKSKVKE